MFVESKNQSRNMALWKDYSIKDYLNKNRINKKLTIFQHIPKTAGSSLVSEMREHIGGYLPINVNYKRFSGNNLVYSDIRPELETELHSALDEVFVKYNPETVRAISGHLYRPHMNRLFNVFPNSFYFSFMRHPVTRVISDYRYQCTPQHPPHESFIRTYPTINHYLDLEDDHNKAFDYLVGCSTKIEEGISHVDNNYTFIGIQEMYPMSFNILFRFHGKNIFPKMHSRPTQDLDINRVEINQKLRHKILDLNQKDMALYKHFHDKMICKKNEWQQMLKESSHELYPET